MYRRSTMGASGITDDMPVTESVDRLPAAGSTPVFVFEGDDLRWHGIGWQDKPSSGGGPPRGGGRVSARLAPKPVIVCWIGTAWKRLPSPVSELGAVLFAWLPASAAIVHWNGTTWTRAPSPSPVSGSCLYGVAVTSVPATAGWSAKPD